MLIVVYNTQKIVPLYILTKTTMNATPMTFKQLNEEDHYFDRLAQMQMEDYIEYKKDEHIANEKGLY